MLVNLLVYSKSILFIYLSFLNIFSLFYSYFKNFINSLRPAYKIPSQDTINTSLSTLYHQLIPSLPDTEESNSEGILMLSTQIFWKFDTYEGCLISTRVWRLRAPLTKSQYCREFTRSQLHSCAPSTLAESSYASRDNTVHVLPQVVGA